MTLPVAIGAVGKAVDMQARVSGFNFGSGMNLHRFNAKSTEA